MSERHYIVQAGLQNSVPEDVEVMWNLTQAVEIAAQWFGLSDYEQSKLFVSGHCYLDILRDGADYVEIYECRCGSPHWHYAPIERKQWAKDSESIITVIRQ